MGRADSATLKARKARESADFHMRLAVQAYTAEQSKREGRRSLRDVASQYRVSHVTLSRQYKGALSVAAFNTLKQKITVSEEKILVDYALESADRGLPILHAVLASMANKLLESRLGAHYVPVGLNWSDRFVERHYKSLQMHWTKPLDTQRACALNPRVVKHWFSLVKEHIVDKGIKLHNIYGMDESGFPPGVIGRERVIGRHGTRLQHKQGGADHENVTALVTICADGTALVPTIVFKGMNFMKQWGEDNVARASYVVVFSVYAQCT
jgi:hypothetical protein